MNVLALDQGVTTGWAFSNKRITGFGSKDLTALNTSGGAVYAAFGFWLEDMIFSLRPELVAFETPIFRGKNSRFLFGFAAIIEMLAERAGVSSHAVNPKHLKSVITGNGNASKEQVEAAIAAMGYRPRNDHEADAIGILLIAKGGAAPCNN